VEEGGKSQFLISLKKEGGFIIFPRCHKRGGKKRILAGNGGKEACFRPGVGGKGTFGSFFGTRKKKKELPQPGAKKGFQGEKEERQMIFKARKTKKEELRVT